MIHCFPFFLQWIYIINEFTTVWHICICLFLFTEVYLSKSFGLCIMWQSITGRQHTASSWKKSEKVSLVLYQLLQYKTDRQNKTGRNKIKGLRPIGKDDVSPTAAPVRTRQWKKKKHSTWKRKRWKCTDTQINNLLVACERVLEATITPHPRSQSHTKIQDISWMAEYCSSPTHQPLGNEPPPKAPCVWWL